MASVGLSKEQRDLIVRIGTFVLLVVIASIISTYLSSTVEDLERKHLFLKNEISDMDRKLEGLNKKTLEFSEGVKTWEALSEEDKALSGLRINDAKDTLDKLQAKYKFSAVKTSFSKPEEIIGDYKTDTVTMVSSSINMTFNALSDEFVYKFIADISKNFPGFVQVKSLSINKPVVINKDILKKISMGEDVQVISVTIDFYWHDLKYKGPATAPVAPGGPPK